MFKKTVKYAVVFFVAMITLYFIRSGNEDSYTSSRTPSSEFLFLIPENKPLAIEMITKYIENDIKLAIYNPEKKSLASRMLPLTNIDKFLKEYRSNEVKANNKYKGKLIRTIVIVDSIAEDAYGSPYVLSKTGAGFEFIKLNFDKKNPDILETDSNNVIDVVCIGAGMTLTMPVLNDCQFSAPFFHKSKSISLSNLIKAWDGDYKPLSKYEALIMATASSLIKKDDQIKMDDNMKKAMESSEGLLQFPLIKGSALHRLIYN